MFISDYVLKAKLGDEKAFLWLINHFENYFCNNVVKYNNNENLRKDAKEKLPFFIRKYLDNNYKVKIDSYLRICAQNEFKKIIDEKYDLFFNAYVNGVCKKDLRNYILTRFNEYLNKRKLPHNLTDEQQEEKEFQKYSNIKYIDKNLECANINHPYNKIKDILNKYYDEILEDYFKYNRKTEIKTYINYKLRNKINELVLLYNDEEIKNISLKFMKLNLLDKDILEEMIANLTNYYLSNKMNNSEPYELFIINRLKNFDYDEYYKIKEIKENIKVKVRRR